MRLSMNEKQVSLDRKDWNSNCSPDLKINLIAVGNNMSEDSFLIDMRSE
jgi:hypothetical protein